MIPAIIRYLAGIPMLLALSLLAGCGSGERDFVLNSIPERPDLSGLPDRLHQRIENAELRALDGGDPVQGLAELARVYHANGFFEEASQCYQALSVCEPNEGKWPHLLAEILSGYGQLNEALPWRQKAVELAPDHTPAWVRLGDNLLKQNRTSEAAQAYEAALKSETDNAYALIGLARVDIENRKLENARARLEMAIKVSDLRIGSDLLASVYQDLGLQSQVEAIRGLTKSSGSFSDIPDPWVAELYAESVDPYQIAVAAGMAGRGGDTAASIRLLNRAIQLAPEDAMLYFQMALIHREQGQAQLAIENLNKCVEYDPKFSDGWFHLARIYAELEDREAESVALATGLFHNPDSPGLHLANATRLKRESNFTAAIREYEKAIELRPEEADPYVELASLYIGEMEFTKGIELLNRALAIESLHPLALSTISIFHIAQGNEAEARKSLSNVKLQPRISQEDKMDLYRKFYQKFGSTP